VEDTSLVEESLSQHSIYDVRFADGREEHGVDLNAVLQGARFPADYWSTLDGANHACPEEGTGPWVDYPYAGRSNQPRALGESPHKACPGSKDVGPVWR
jgi:hypothetical protein